MAKNFNPNRRGFIYSLAARNNTSIPYMDDNVLMADSMAIYNEAVVGSNWIKYDA